MKKTVLVTGVARGIGKAIAERFLNEGFVVHGTYFTSKKEAMDLQMKYGNDNLILHGPYNFCDINQIELLLSELLKYKFDIIIPCAGIFSDNDDFYHFDLNNFQHVMNCNFYAPLLLCIGLQNRINKYGSIIIMSSNDAYSGAYTSISYSVSKSALINLTKCLSVNFGRNNIRVNSVAPGSIDTDMNTPEQMSISPLYTPIQRVGQAAEIANVVYFLASNEASFINGENITIDGGYSNVSILLKGEADSLR